MAETKKRPSILLVLDALYAGQDVKLGDIQYRMVEGQLCMVGARYKGGDLDNPQSWEEVLFGTDNFMTFNGFLKDCDKLSEQDLFNLAAGTVLRQSRASHVRHL